MKFARPLFVAILVMALAEASFAFDRCETLSHDPGKLSRELSTAAILRSPVKYHDLARSIRLETTNPGDTLTPFAADQQGTKFIVFPPLFANVACKIAFAEYLIADGIQRDAYDQAAEAAAKCFDAGGSQKRCLVGFANELARRYGNAFAGITPDEKEVAFSIYEATLHQIMMHEYAHHFLDHFSRIRVQQVTRVDAEFEADFFAVMNGVQSAEPPSAMYYFFNGLAEIERHTKKLATPDYESGRCRSGNVVNITGFFGVTPMLLVDAAFGGGSNFRRSSPSQVRAFAKKQSTGAPPALISGSCGRIAKVALGAAYEELKILYGRMDKDLDFLFAKEEDVARANRLLRDLAEMSVKFRYMDGIAAKSMSMMLRSRGLEGRELTPLVGQVDRLLNTPAVADKFLSGDYGRLLQAQGLSILQERVDLTAKSRMDRSYALFQRAVFYNPDQHEAWMNLAMIAVKRGDCAAASRFVNRAIDTYTENKDDHRKSLEAFASTMKKLSIDPEACRKVGAEFHPYPGL